MSFPPEYAGCVAVKNLILNSIRLLLAENEYTPLLLETFVCFEQQGYTKRQFIQQRINKVLTPHRHNRISSYRYEEGEENTRANFSFYKKIILS